MSFSQYDNSGPNKLRVEDDDPPKSSLNYFGEISAKTPEKQQSKISKWVVVGGLAFTPLVVRVCTDSALHSNTGQLVGLFSARNFLDLPHRVHLQLRSPVWKFLQLK